MVEELNKSLIPAYIMSTSRDPFIGQIFSLEEVMTLLLVGQERG